MAITFVQQKKKQRYFLIALAVVVGAGGLFYGVRFVQRNTLYILPILRTEFSLERDLEIDFEILDSQILQELGRPRDPIPRPELSKRDNPFLPFENGESEGL